MALSTVPDTVSVEIKQLLFGRFLESVLHFRNTLGTVNPATLNDLGDDLADWLNIWWAPILSQDLLFTEAYIKSLDLTAPYEATRPLGIQGENANDSSPVNVAMCLHLFTGMIGRSYKGKMYQSGVVEGDVTGNDITSAFQIAAQTAAEEMLAIFPAHDWEPVVVSRIQDQTVIDPAVATTVTILFVDNKVHDMGRRLDNGT